MDYVQNSSYEWNMLGQPSKWNYVRVERISLPKKHQSINFQTMDQIK